MRHLHLGVHPRHVINLRRAVREAHIPHAIHVDGDGWNAWGEAPGTDVNDLLTLHAVVEVPDHLSREEAHVLVQMILDKGVALVPARWPGHEPALWEFTTAEDWSEPIVDPKLEEEEEIPQAHSGAAREAIEAINVLIREAWRAMDNAADVGEHAYANGQVDAYSEVIHLLNEAQA